MNFGINPYEVGFTLLSPFVAILLWHQREISVVVAVTLGCAFASWLLMFASEAWIDQQWAVLIENTPNPSVELIREADSDAASKTAIFAFWASRLAGLFPLLFFGGSLGKMGLEKCSHDTQPEARR